MLVNIGSPVHFAPYGRWNYWWGKYHCGALHDEPYSTDPEKVTCAECQRMSPGLWPEKGSEKNNGDHQNVE